MKYFVSALLLFILIPLGAQSPAASVQQLLKQKTPAQQVLVLDSLAKTLRSSDFRQSVRFSQQAIALARKQELHKEHVTSIMTLCRSYRSKSLHDSALLCIDSARTVAESHELKEQYASILDTEGLIYMRQSNYTKAVTCFYKAVAISEQQKDTSGIRDAFNHLGIVTFYRRDYPSSITFYRKALAFIDPVRELKIYVSTMDNIGISFSNSKQLDSAMRYQQLAAARAPLLHDSTFLAEVYINLSATLLLLKKHDQAKPYIDTAYAIHSAQQNEYGLILANTYRARLLYQTGRAAEALPWIEKAYTIAKRLDIPEQLKETTFTLTDVYEALGDYKTANNYYTELVGVMERISKDENAKAINELSAQYESEKQQQKIELLTRDTLLQEERIATDRKLKFFYGAIALLFLVLSGVFIYRFQEKKKANRLLEEKTIAIALQKQQIETQKQELEQRNKETTDSINYARRIQGSVLPSEQFVRRLLPESFICFRPKDIVSGDFYWISEKISATETEERSIYFAVADCTGHGVPGAMMAMLSASLLNQIVATPEVKSPATVLRELHLQVVRSMNENMTLRESNDGLDIALVQWEVDRRVLRYAGAGRSLVYRQGDGPLQVFAHNKYSIGDYTELAAMQFQEYELSLEVPTLLYLFSDGIADQFGGPNGKKFMSKRLLELLDTMAKQPIGEQGAIFNAAFDSWKGTVEQTDDVALAGIRLC